MNFLIFMSGVALGLVPLVVGIWLWREHTARTKAEFEEQTAMFSKAVARKDVEVQQLEAEQQKLLKDQSVRHGKNLERLREWLARGIRWEESSRRQLVQACESLGVNGFVATNVCFMVHRGSTPYIHQLDHVVVADSMLFVVEAKNWKGKIFHRQRFEDGREPFSIDALPIFDNVAAQERYVTKIEEDGSMFWLPDKKTPEPVEQVQEQSIQFKNFVTKSLGLTPGNVLNCVLYSHPDSCLQGGARTFGKYTWVTHQQELLPVLEQMQHQRRKMDAPAVPVADLHKLLESLGADIVGVGRYAGTWQSVFPLERQQRSYRKAR